VNTFQEQKAFFDEHWPAMKQAAESGGGPAIVDYVRGIDDELERRVLWVFAHFGLVNEEWEGKDLSAYIEVCDAGLEEILGQAEAADDDEEKAKRLNTAHVLSYNLAADLAPCWPDDSTSRTKAHFLRGRKAAEDCLAWCAEDRVDGLSRDHWVRGIHQLSLGDVDGAAESWATSLDLAKKLAAEAGEPTEVSPEAGFGVILGTGYLGLARAVRGETEGEEQLASAIKAFTVQLGFNDRRDDATFGIAQLQLVMGRHGIQ
jgi:hypothetical protein